MDLSEFIITNRWRLEDVKLSLIPKVPNEKIDFNFNFNSEHLIEMKSTKL